MVLVLAAAFELRLACRSAWHWEERMGFFDMFRRKPPICDRDGLAQFIDEHAAFLAQKGIYEYSRARAGHYAKVLMTRTGLPGRGRELALASLSARPRHGRRGGGRHPPPPPREDRRAGLDALIAIVLDVFDRYPTPAALGETAWREARADLARRLDLVSLHPPKFAKDIRGAVRGELFSTDADPQEIARDRIPHPARLSQGDAVQYP